MLKKIGLVTIATIGLSLAATPAFATPAPADHQAAAATSKCASPTCDSALTLDTAYWTFLTSGADLGQGTTGLITDIYLDTVLTVG